MEERGWTQTAVLRRHEAEWNEQRRRQLGERDELRRRHAAEWDEQIRRDTKRTSRTKRQHEAELARQREADRAQQQHQQQEVIILHYGDDLDMGELIQQDEITTSLSEEVISRNLKTRNPDSKIIRDDGDPKICTVCQDNLRDNDRKKMIAILDCGHEYHSCCIKKWLQRKNICPLCKRVAIKL
ncbi:hypothetical protein DH2020_048018 [Rehmannia glutinosa]|uniref:RING-type E3 ubiquitin transferase n=1 Tax=Rehmannia glutinosa TaxID=99300 RepID=A0ABR0U758_REHGL